MHCFASAVARHRELAENISGMEVMSFLVAGWLDGWMAKTISLPSRITITNVSCGSNP